VNNVQSTSTTMTVGISKAASSGGLIAWQRSTMIGATDLGDANAFGQMYIDGGAPSATTTGLAINPS
jgi:hypothetical protein